MSRIRPAPCPICTVVPAGPRIELDLMMADPARWPARIFELFDKPTGLPPGMREWGAIEVGEAWLREHGYGDLDKPDVRLHYERHVPLVPVDPAGLVEAGVIATAGDKVPDPTIDPLAYLRYLAAGVEVGRKGLRLLEEHVENLVKKKQEVPVSLIRLMVDTGAKLAINQANIRSRQKSQPELGDEDEDDLFRGPETAPSPRIGHVRIRTVNGERRPVYDEGPKDREAYNRRARQEGGEQL